MSFVAIKSKYHVALDGQGLILQGAPDRLAYQQGQAPVYGTRFASGDRSYNDLSQWWYFVQTSWSAGFKDFVSWADDAKYYYATNIDAWSENGAIKLARKPVSDNDFSEDIACGAEIEVNGTTGKYIGTYDNASNEPLIYEYTSSWNDIYAGQSTSNQNVISQLSGRAGVMWISTVGVGNTNVVVTWSGSAFTDQSSYIITAMGGVWTGMGSSRCHLHYQGTTYVFIDDSANDRYGLIKTTSTNPTGSGNWTKVFDVTNVDGVPVACEVYNGFIYYIVNYSSRAELHAWSIADATDTLVATFRNTSLPNWGVGDKLLKVLNGKLIITIPTKEIWQIDGSTLSRIYNADEYKYNNFNTEARAYLGQGCIIADNKAFWGNLMYDGTYFFNTWKDFTDATTSSVYPLFVDSDGVIYQTDSVDDSILFSYTLTGGSYKGSADKNYLIFNNFDVVSGVDKLAYSATVIFKPLISGQSITIEYLTGELTTSASWTTLGTASFTADGGSVTDKTFYFTEGTTFKKMWIRVKFTAGGSDTPTMTDFVMEYLPVPTYKKTWALNVNCGDDVKRLDGALVSDVGRELKSRLERSWWTKSVLDFQDVDYATTQLNGALTAAATTVTVDDTADFPEQGRIRIEAEEITYTGKTPTTFTGCTRGARSTRAASHTDNTVVNNAYKVIITELGTRVPIILEDKELEYVVSLGLREV